MQATFLHLDVSNEQEWDRTVVEVLKIYGKLTSLVNNAGSHLTA